MDVIEKTYPKQQIITVMNVLQFNSNPIQLVGTGGLKSQLYPADYDFMSKIIKKLSVENSYIEFQNILNDIQKQSNLFFIEFKFQMKNGDKFKILDIGKFNRETFDKYFKPKTIQYCKIDLILNLSGHFKEVSCIYFFSDELFDVKTYTQALLKDAKDYYDDGKYYKSLKRLMIASKTESPPDRNLIVAISKLFNSEVGKLYQKKNEIDAGIIFMEKYNSLFDGKLVKVFIKNIGLKDMSPDKLQDLSDAYGDLINKEGLKFYEKYKLKAGELPQYNTIKGGAKKNLLFNL
jgi:hypothetical protein